MDATQAKQIREQYESHQQARKNRFPGQCSFTKEQMDQLPPLPTNDEVGLLEEFDWKSKPPIKYFVYVQEINNRPMFITNWTGITLGTITKCGKVLNCHTPSGGHYQKRHIIVNGTNGKMYQGWYHCSNGTYARIKMKRTK